MAQAIEEQKENIDANKSKDEKPEDEPEELSEEDQALKDGLEAHVTLLSTTSDATAGMSAIENMGKEIRTATTSMTSVPKPLKFLRPHYQTIKAAHETVPDKCKPALADVISVLATVGAEEADRECLSFRLKGTGGDPSAWGHEYMRHLAGEIASEYSQRSSMEPPGDTADLMGLVEVIVPYYMHHNSEPEAVDLLLEVDSISGISEHVDDKNADRTCRYLVAVSAYLAFPDNGAALSAAYDSYLKVGKVHDAMRVALNMNDRSRAEKVFVASEGELDKQQLGYLLARQGVMLDCEEGPCTIEDEDLREKVVGIMSNVKLSERFLALARDLDVLEPKVPEDVYKMHLVDTHRSGLGPSMDSAAKNLSATLVNALVNLGFGNDKLVTIAQAEGERTWISRNKDQGKTCAVASIGAISLWDVDGGMPQIDKYTYSEDPNIVAGSCLGFGLCCCCVRSELDPAFALLSEHVHATSPQVRVAAVMALGLAYAGTGKEDVRELLLPLISPEEASVELVAHAALALGVVFAGTKDGEVTDAMIQWLMLAEEPMLEHKFARFVALGLGFLFLGQQEAVEATLEVARSVHERIAKVAAVLLDTCAHAGTGNVLKVQEMLSICGETIDAEEGAEWKKAHQTFAAMGVGLIAMGEDLGITLAGRALEHLLSYGDAEVRAGVPGALALLHASHPDVYTMDTLSRLSHDSDSAVARAALLSLGVIGAGTNNARLAGMLRNLSSYYYKDAAGLHLVRVAQGLLHMGKGLTTLSPYHSDRSLLSPRSLAALLTLLHCGTDPAATLCGKPAYMLYYICPAVRPRMLLTVDESGDVVPVSVRVGTAVDTVAQAGQPKSITGFQTHDTPALLATGDRAELASEKYVSVSPLLEGIVIVKRNPAFIEGSD